MSPQRVIRPVNSFVRQWWPVMGVGLFIVLGFVAFVIVGNLINDVKNSQQSIDRQQETIAHNQVAIRATTIANRRLGCAISKAIAANPIVRIPQFETKAAFRRRVDSLHLILRLTKGIDCDVVLAPVSTAATKPRQLPRAKGTAAGSSSSSPSTPMPSSQPTSPSTGGGGGSGGGGGGGSSPGSPGPPGPPGPPGGSGPPGQSPGGVGGAVDDLLGCVLQGDC